MNSSDTGVVAISRHAVESRREQRATADAAMAHWREEPLPAGCLSVDCLLSTDGQLVMYYSRWTGADRVVELGAGGAHLDTTVSTTTGRPGEQPIAGCVALIRIATGGADLQRQAAERIAAFSADAHPGAIGGHVLFSLDGTRLTLYAEWTSEEAHREAIAGAEFGGRGGIFDDTPGVDGLTMHRFQRYRTVPGQDGTARSTTTS